MEIVCKYHEYTVLMIQVETNIYECPVCGALCIAKHDPAWSTVDGVSWELTWMSRGTRVEDVA